MKWSTSSAHDNAHASTHEHRFDLTRSHTQVEEAHAQCHVDCKQLLCAHAPGSLTYIEHFRSITVCNLLTHYQLHQFPGGAGNMLALVVEAIGTTRVKLCDEIREIFRDVCEALCPQRLTLPTSQQRNREEAMFARKVACLRAKLQSSRFFRELAK